MQGLERAELLGDGERGMVGEHDAAGAEADGVGVGADMGDEHAGGRGGDRGHVVVLGVPDTSISPVARRAGRAATLAAKLSVVVWPLRMGARSRIESGMVMKESLGSLGTNL